MAGNSLGKLFKFTTWGESHGPSIGVVVDGVPSLIEIDETFIQQFLDKRKPGNSKHTTQRKEPDRVEILSGVYEGKTTGCPILLKIDNVDQRSKDYSNISTSFRPGHADFAYIEKYGIRDPRGGGRSSARETASRVAAGAIARKVLPENIEIIAYVKQIGYIKFDGDYNDIDFDFVQNNDLFAPNQEIYDKWDELLSTVRKNGSSIGAIIEVIAKNVPSGLGEPVYDKMDSDLAKAMMSINAVKGVEIGAGFEACLYTGEDNADEIFKGKKFGSNNAGGILGGITTGQDIVLRFAVKPTSSILTPKKTINTEGEEEEIFTKGRHDPCVGIRAVPVGEAMMALVLADHYLRNRGIYNKV